MGPCIIAFTCDQNPGLHKTLQHEPDSHHWLKSVYAATCGAGVYLVTLEDINSVKNSSTGCVASCLAILQ